jgi:flagellar biogenesis protein FliO
MSNKMTIKRTAEPVKETKKMEKDSWVTKNGRNLAGLIPVILFIVVAIWYFITSGY